MKIKHTTRLETLLENYPQLKLKLTTLLPAFSDLKQQALKDKVLKIATVEHLARITEQEVPDLIKDLKETAGISTEDRGLPRRPEFLPDDPAWIQGPLRKEIDGTEMLSRGKHPLSEVKSALTTMDEREVLLLSTNFLPRPMIEAMEEAGREVYSREDTERPGHFLTFIQK